MNLSFCNINMECVDLTFSKLILQGNMYLFWKHLGKKLDWYIDFEMSCSVLFNPFLTTSVFLSLLTVPPLEPLRLMEELIPEKVLNLEKLFHRFSEYLESLSCLLVWTRFLQIMRVTLMLEHSLNTLETLTCLLLDIHVHIQWGWEFPLFVEKIGLDKIFLDTFCKLESTLESYWSSNKEIDYELLLCDRVNTDLDQLLPIICFVTLPNFSLIVTLTKWSFQHGLYFF